MLQWSALQILSPRDRTGQLGRLVSRGRESCLHPWSPSDSTTCGARAPLRRPWACQSPGPWFWWSRFPERCEVWASLVHNLEEFSLEDLENSNGVKRQGRLSSWSVGASSECWSRSTGLGRVGDFCLPADGHGRAEMRSHRLIKRWQFPVAFFFCDVYSGEGGWRGIT